MIELRWVKRDAPVTHMGDNIVQKGRVLQYRLLLDATPPTTIETETKAVPIHFTVYKAWTPWMDVPEVSAE